MVRNHFEYDCDTIVKYNPNYAKTVEQAIKEMGENSDEFLMNYKLKWLFNFGMYINAEEFTQEPIALLDGKREVRNDVPVIVGMDIGKSQDSTVLTVGIPDYSKPLVIEKAKEADAEDYVLFNIRVIDWLEIVGDSYEEQFYMVKDYLSKFNVKLLMVDGTGVGSPIVDRLAAHVDFPVRPFIFTPQNKSVLMKYFNACLRSKCFHYPASEEVQKTVEYKKFMEQCLEATKDYKGDRLVVAAPRERNKHDDYLFSAALMVWGLRHAPEGIEVSNENVFLQTKSIFSNKSRRYRRW